MNQEVLKTLLLYFGIFTFGVTVGVLGNLTTAEILVKHYNFTIDNMVKIISYIYAVSFVGLYFLIAIPVTIIATCPRNTYRNNYLSNIQ